MAASDNNIKIFGHKVPDTDTVASAIVYAWYYTNIKKRPADAYVLGELNKETEYVLERFGFDTPPLLESFEDGDKIVVVDTNNTNELPDNIHDVELVEIIDHHKLAGGIITPSPVTVTMRPLASTASLIYTVMNPELHTIPENVAGLMLSALISDTLALRSPTTTEEDRLIAETLAGIANVEVQELAGEMFTAKSDISHLQDEELLVMDSKVFDIKGKKLRVSVIETTNPEQPLGRKEGIKEAIQTYVENNDVQDVLLFVVDILNENAVPIVAAERAQKIVEDAFDVQLDPQKDTVLEGIVSRKKQIIPRLEA